MFIGYALLRCHVPVLPGLAVDPSTSSGLGSGSAPSGGIATLEHVEGQPVEILQDFVDLVLGPASPAWRPAGFQRPVPM